jgi:two-component system LytT family sensor kinase
MNRRLATLFENRTWRHIIFWICWVTGFTLVKSFGKPYEIYFGWFSYYVVTLPIFISHTYIVAYVLIPQFFSRKLWPLFVVLFLGFFYGFSVLELILSNEFIYRWYPTGSEVIENYLVPGNVIRSGLGNLYIVLVFIAARTVRNWFLAENRQKELMQVDLKQQMEDTIARVQPKMLLYAIDQIDKMVERSSPDVTRAIALTSELLSEVMMYHEEKNRWFAREIDLVKKLISLVTVLRGSRPEVEFFISGDPGVIDLPPMILFSFVDLFFRRFEHDDELPELNIEASAFSNMINIQLLHNGNKEQNNGMEVCMETITRLESLYSERVTITHETHNYGCSVVIRNSAHESGNAIHRIPMDVDTAKTVGA